MTRCVTLLLVAALVLVAQPRIGPEGASLIAMALADDDDDDDGRRRVQDDDDDDDGPVRRRTRIPVSPVATPAPVPLPQRAENEILAHGLSQDDLTGLLQLDFALLESDTLSSGQMLARLRKPATLSMDDALAVVRGVAEAEASDFNHFFRSEEGAACQGIDCPARLMLNWPVSSLACGPLPRIGMVDTGLNADHEALSEARIVPHRLGAGDAPSDLLHGTAVAALLVGEADSRTPGLVPDAELLTVDAFHRAGQDQRSDAFTLIRALDYLAARQVRIVNLSLAGPANTALEAQIDRMHRMGTILIAAAGNNGPAAPPAYPAAYPEVIAVTAVDRRGEVYRRAGRGPHIDLAAPGVDVWTAASISGARTKTGTSYAAPFVSAAAALLLQDEPGLTNDEVRDRLLADARDLGEAGRDNIFGQGLISPPAPCSS